MSHGCNGGVPQECPSTPATKSASNATSPTRHLTILERRAPWREDFGPEWTSFPIARLRYTATAKTWTLYWRDRNLRFHRYDLLEPSPRFKISSLRSTATPPPSSGANTNTTRQ